MVNLGKCVLVDSLNWEIMNSLNKVYVKVLLKNSDCEAFGLTIHKIDCGGKVPKHSHKEESLYYFLEGSGKVYLGEDTIGVQPGLVVYISSCETHGIENTGEDNIKYLEIKSPNTVK